MTQDARPARTPKSRPRPRWRAPTALACAAAVAVIGCATISGDSGQALVPDRVATRSGPFVIYTDTKIAPDDEAVRSLLSLENDLTSHLGLRVAADEPAVEVYVLKDRPAFSHFLQFYHPELPPRRAFFLAQGPKRMVYTYVNVRLEEDLRHEATHALLHTAVGDLPLWLDEGLAEYFEGPNSRDGVNPEHLARLPDDLKTGWHPDLARLETRTTVREMTPCDYRESWAWVHYLLNGSTAGKAAVLGYLADLRTDPGRAAPLSTRIEAGGLGGGTQLLTHLDRVRTSSTPIPAPLVSAPGSDRSIILMQNSPIDAGAGPAPSPRRPWMGKYLAALWPWGRKPSVGR